MSNKSKSPYKGTLNLPKTDFDMRAALLKKEPAIQARWKDENLYEQIRKARADAPKFILHDGPPYANGDIHMGHALNKTLKDIVIRYKTMTGYDAPIIHGWDCHGLPIEYRVQSEVGDDLAKMSRADIRERCARYAAKYVGIQSEQFQRLGVIGEMDKPRGRYVTMDPAYEQAVLEVLARLVDQGLVYQQLKPVHWSIENRTALAEAELEYQDREDSSIYVLFAADPPADLKRVFDLDDAPEPIGLMIWTTTPWTLPANLAVAVHPEFEYSAVRFSHRGEKVITVVATELVEAVFAAGGIDDYEMLASARGAALADSETRYRHPLVDGKVCPIVPANYVTLEDGTGLVHTAPGHGHEDYGTGLQCDLEIYCPVQGDGTFDATAPEWIVGRSVWEANPLIVDFLDRAGTLFAHMMVTHSYPHDWRSRTPTIFRATEQWFVAVDRPLRSRGPKDLDVDLPTLRQMAMESCRKGAADGGMDFIPGWGRKRLAGMLQSRPDWCISRQRSWGLPIPAFLNEAGETLLTGASVRAVAAHFAQKGSDSWFSDSPAEILAGYDPAEDPGVEDPAAFSPAGLTHGYDILDVWFESGSSWFAAAMRLGLIDEIPVDLYLEGSDQHRGWFQLSLLPSLGAVGATPCKTVLTHGFVVTEDGHKMSKSLGNAIDVIEQLSKRGADILRLWISSQDYHSDIRCSEAMIVQAEDAYRKIRNTLRYCMGACFDFDPATDAAEPDEHSLDRWMRLELHRLVRDIRAAYESYEFHRASRMIHEFCTIQASSIYMAAVKDRLYCELPDSPRRRATQSVLHELLVTLIKLLAPIAPHTCEEAWQHIPNRDANEPESVHLALMPEADEETLRLAEQVGVGLYEDMKFEIDTISPSPVMIWQRLMDLRQQGLGQLEALRNSGVKNPLDAEAILTHAADDGASAVFCRTYLSEMEDLLGVGHARVETVEKVEGDYPIAIRVADARDKYARCERSWKRRPDVGSDPDYPDLSARDAAVVKELSRD